MDSTATDCRLSMNEDNPAIRKPDNLQKEV
jgi:hypothetical protein